MIWQPYCIGYFADSLMYMHMHGRHMGKVNLIKFSSENLLFENLAALKT